MAVSPEHLFTRFISSYERDKHEKNTNRHIANAEICHLLIIKIQRPDIKTDISV